MSDQDDTAPGTADTGGPGRRRARVDAVGAELAALRHDLDEAGATLRQHSGLLAEVLPQVSELLAAVTALTATDEAESARDKAEREARRAVGMLDEPPSPWAWPVMHRQDAEQAWAALDRWVEHVLCRQHRLTLGRLPGCWPAHPAAVAELTALRAAHCAAHTKGAHPSAALAWHRELPPALDRITGCLDERCPPGRHDIAPEAVPPQRDRDRVAALPCRPEAWRPLLEQVVAEDLAGRREAPARAEHMNDRS